MDPPPGHPNMRAPNGPKCYRTPFQFYMDDNLDDMDKPEVHLRWKNLPQPGRSVFFFSAWVDWTRYRHGFNYCTEMNSHHDARDPTLWWQHDLPVPTEFLPAGFSPIEINPPIEIGGVCNRRMEMILGVAQKPLTWPDAQPWHPEDLICYVESVVPGGYADKLGFQAGDLPFLFVSAKYKKERTEVYTLVSIEVMLQLLASLPCKIHVLRSNLPGAIRPNPIAGELRKMSNSLIVAST